jgi:hypothetical protein
MINYYFWTALVFNQDFVPSLRLIKFMDKPDKSYEKIKLLDFYCIHNYYCQ